MKLVQLTGIGKSFGATRVLDDVSFDLHAGEVHLLAGENGAGKSTLIKILAGIHHEFDGTIELEGQLVRFASPHEANRRGVSVIHQEMSLVDAMSVADNIYLGREPSRAGGWWLDRGAQLAKTQEICRSLDLEFSREDLREPVERFSLSVKNRIEIAKALSFEAKVLVMDEPTSALNRHEVEKLFRLIETLKARGCGIIYISHKMEEIYRIADRITVLRDGRWVGTATKAECPPDRLVHWMIGREMSQHFPARPAIAAAAGERPALEVRALRVASLVPGRPDAVHGVSFQVRAGEILGIAGLQGSGSTEVFHGLFGTYGRLTGGAVALDGQAFAPATPRAAIRRGLALLTGDRKATGLVLGMSVEHNMTLAALPRFSPRGLLRPAAERVAAKRLAQALRVRLASVEQPAGMLSGGNQQKVVLAKWLEAAPRVLLLEEPTRGVDVGAKHEIYELMNRWTADGMAIVMISTELPELLGVCDRILVMHRGEITAEFARGEATAERVLAAAMGVKAGATSSSEGESRPERKDQT